jgi:hypothetical protein
MPAFVTIENVTFRDVYPSGLAIKVEVDEKEYSIPNYAIDDDSEIWKESTPGEVGKLIITEEIAVDKGLVDPPTRSLGGGIPLKRHRLPDPPQLLSEKRLGTISARWDASSAHEYGWEAVLPSSFEDITEIALRGSDNPGEIAGLTLKNKTIVGMFERQEDALLAAHAPDDIRDLLDENVILREWIAKALKTQERRKRR